MNLIQKISTILLCLFHCQIAFGEIAIIPKPVALTQAKGEIFTLNRDTKIVFGKSLEAEAGYLKMALAPATGFDLLMNAPPRR